MTVAPAIGRAAHHCLLLALLTLAAACGVLDPTFLADAPGAAARAPVEVKVDFTGNASFRTAELRAHVEDYMIDLSRDPTRESSVYDAALEVEDFYRTHGHPVARVGYEYTPVGEEAPWPARVHVLLMVDEGPLVAARMRLLGNAAYGADELLTLWSRQRSGAFGLGQDLFVEAQVRSFVEELRVFYRARARLDAVIGAPRIAVDLAAGVADIEVEIDEGHAHVIRTVVLDEPLRTALGDEAPPPPVGKPHSAAEVRAYGNALRDALRRKGHPDPRIELDPHPVTGAFAADLEVHGEPGPQATVDAIAVAGNRRTLDTTILDKVALRAGDRYDGAKVDESMQRLYRTGLFRKVELRETPVDGDPSRLGLELQVEENESRSIEVQGGYGSYEQLRGALRLEERNLFGTGRGISLDNRVSLKGYSTALTVTDPDFLSSRATLSVSGEYFRREEPAFTDSAVGGTIALARPMWRNLVARTGYTFRERTDPRAFTALPEDQLVDFTEGRVFVELRNDSRDNLLFPQSGHAEFLAFERFAPMFGADVDLDRLVGKVAAHIDVVGSLRLVLRAEVSALWPHEGSARVPLQERWYNGGESSVRSFREAKLGPQDAADLPIGGEYRNLFGTELRLPIWKALESAFFADAGNVGRKVQDYSLTDMGYGLGVGLRVLLPIGPIRVDAAWNPDRQPGDSSWVAHISVGYPF